MIFDDLAAILDLCEYFPYYKNDFTRFSPTAYNSSILYKNTTKVSISIFSRSNSTLLLLILENIVGVSFSAIGTPSILIHNLSSLIHLNCPSTHSYVFEACKQWIPVPPFSKLLFLKLLKLL